MIARWLNRRAARRLLGLLHEHADKEKTADQLTVESFLWRVLDDDVLAKMFTELAHEAREIAS